MRHALALIALFVTASAASARDLPVPPDKGWQHAATNIVLRTPLLGLPRTRLSDSTDGEYDVAANFESADHNDVLSVFIFHPGLPSVPVWFDRAQTQITMRDIWGGATPLAPPAPLAAPGAGAASGLRQTFAAHGALRSTAVAVVPVKDWLVAIRISSATIEAAALDARLSAAIAAIGWPTDIGTAPAARPIEACASSLSYRKAKLLAPDMAQSLIAAAMAGAATEKLQKDPPKRTLQCRDGAPMLAYAAYRDPAVRDGYMLAVGDAGRAVSIYPGLAIPPATPGWAIAFHDLDGSIANYPQFDRLPQPQQVVDLVLHTAPLSRWEGGGRNTVTIGIDSKK